jgi:hypothetical protein
MNRTRHLVIVSLAVFAVVFCESSSRAAALAYTDGDLLLGFQAVDGTGATQDYLVNIGKASTFRDATTAFNLSLGNIAVDLATTFGDDWNTRPDLFWGVFGAVQDTPVNGDGAWTLYAGKVELSIGTIAQAYNRGSVSTQSAPASKIGQVGFWYKTNYTSTANSSVAAIQNVSDANSYAQYQTNGGLTSFAYFNGAQGNFGSGTAGTALDLFRMATGSSSTKGTYEGTFTISDSGVVSFSPIPEPATWMMLAFGIGFLVLRRKRLQAFQF